MTAATVQVPAARAARGSTVTPFPAPVAPGPVFEYTVAVPSLARGSLHVTLRVSGWPGRVLALHGVPRYLDNPTPAAAGTVLGPLSAFDRKGGAVAVRRTAGARGDARYEIRVTDGEARIEYDLRVRFGNSRQTSRYSIQIPFMNRDRAWLYGNCVFVAPELNADERQGLRTPVDLRLHFEPGPGIVVAGPGANDVRLPNVFGLLSLQFGFGRFHVESVPQGTTPITVVLPDTAEFSPAERRALRQTAVRSVECVARFFDAVPFPSVTFYFFRHHGMGGQEGAYALQSYAPPGLSLADSTGRAGVFRRVAVHEYFHTWMPITLFGHDDPWLKEGVTSYYGEVLGARLGWSSPADRERMFDRFERFAATNPRLRQVPLTDARIWDHEYDDESWRSLTYERGMVVSLLLDVWVRERTQNSKSLDDVMRLLAARHAHRSFGHAELLSAVCDTAGADPAAWFARWVEGTELPDHAALQSALARATELGVFEPGGVPVPPTR